MFFPRLSDPKLTAHYKGLVDEYGEHDRLMLCLVEALARKDYADWVSVGTSHDALVFVAGRDAVTVETRGPRTFEVRYWDHQTNKVEKRICEYFEAGKLIDALILRLSLQGSFSTEDEC